MSIFDFLLLLVLAHAQHGVAWIQGNAWKLGNERQFPGAGKQEYAFPSEASSSKADRKELDAKVLDVLSECW